MMQSIVFVVKVSFYGSSGFDSVMMLVLSRSLIGLIMLVSVVMFQVCSFGYFLFSSDIVMVNFLGVFCKLMLMVSGRLFFMLLELNLILIVRFLGKLWIVIVMMNSQICRNDVVLGFLCFVLKCLCGSFLFIRVIVFMFRRIEMYMMVVGIVLFLNIGFVVFNVGMISEKNEVDSMILVVKLSDRLCVVWDGMCLNSMGVVLIVVSELVVRFLRKLSIIGDRFFMGGLDYFLVQFEKIFVDLFLWMRKILQVLWLFLGFILGELQGIFGMVRFMVFGCFLRRWWMLVVGIWFLIMQLLMIVVWQEIMCCGMLLLNLK